MERGRPGPAPFAEHPRRPPVQTGNPGNFDLGDGDLVFSPDGRILASASGTDQITLWNVTHPARATRIATLRGRPGDYFTALAFSPQANLLAGVTFHGNVLVFRLADPGHPVRVTTRPHLLASARFPGGGAARPTRALLAAQPPPMQSASPQTAMP